MMKTFTICIMTCILFCMAPGSLKAQSPSSPLQIKVVHADGTSLQIQMSQVLTNDQTKIFAQQLHAESHLDAYFEGEVLNVIALEGITASQVSEKIVTSAREVGVSSRNLQNFEKSVESKLNKEVAGEPVH